MSDTSARVDVLLSVQRALLGAVSPSLRGVAVDWQDLQIRIVCYFDGPISEEDQEGMQVVETEVIADFPDFDVVVETIRCDAPASMDTLREWIYHRRE